jgi:hypothetical protein
MMIAAENAATLAACSYAGTQRTSARRGTNSEQAQDYTDAGRAHTWVPGAKGVRLTGGGCGPEQQQDDYNGERLLGGHDGKLQKQPTQASSTHRNTHPEQHGDWSNVAGQPAGRRRVQSTYIAEDAAKQRALKSHHAYSEGAAERVCMGQWRTGTGPVPHALVGG